MLRRRREAAETADERLDRLLEAERLARERRTEVRLGAPAGAIGDGGSAEAGRLEAQRAETIEDVSQPQAIADEGQGNLDRLQPLFQDLVLSGGDGARPMALADPAPLQLFPDQGQGSDHDQGRRDGRGLLADYGQGAPDGRDLWHDHGGRQHGLEDRRGEGAHPELARSLWQGGRPEALAPRREEHQLGVPGMVQGPIAACGNLIQGLVDSATDVMIGIGQSALTNEQHGQEDIFPVMGPDGGVDYLPLHPFREPDDHVMPELGNHGHRDGAPVQGEHALRRLRVSSGTQEVRPGGTERDQEVELLRQRVLRQAEETFRAERRIRGEDQGSYHTASSGGNGNVAGMGIQAQGGEGGANAGAAVQSVTSPGVMRVQPQTAPSPPPGLRACPVTPHGPQPQAMTSPVGYGTQAVPSRVVQQTPGYQGGPQVQHSHGYGMVPQPQGHGGMAGGNTPVQAQPVGVGAGRAPAATVGMERPMPSIYGDPVKGGDLPPLPQPGSENGPLLFGDWLILVKPVMFDISQGARDWWLQIMGEVEDLYAIWLQASPLQRLRLRPAENGVNPAFQRIEMKGVNMLLQVLPEGIKKDVVSSRTLSSSNIMFKLFTVFQPGGGSERAGLLKQIAEPKITGGTQEVLGALRNWRRWLVRAQELGLVLPDAMILASVLGRFSDSLTKLGSSQLGFRLSTMRQDLGIDHRPTTAAVMDMAEYLQAEAEELALLHPTKTTTTAVSNPQPNPGAPAVKAMSYGNGGDQTQDRSKTGRAPCRFWKTEEGCKKGAECTYLHDATDMKGRCFGCGSTLHVKKECPVSKKTGETAPKSEKVKKIQKPKSEKGDPKEKEERSTSSTSATASKEDPKKEESSGSHPKERPTVIQESPEVTQGTPVTATDELLKEAANLLKSLKGLKAIRLKSIGEGHYGKPGEFALLDGGATHALRMAKQEELSQLIPTEVELAHGTTTLYRVGNHQTLLSKTEVEPIIPLGWLVQNGYHIDWSREGCVIQHPLRGPLPCVMRGGCPVMKRSHGLELLEDLEKGLDGSTNRLAEEAMSWWEEQFPGIPQRLHQWIEGQGKHWKDCGPLPWNRHVRRRLWRSKGIVLHLFAGDDHRPWSAWRKDGIEVLCLDIRKGGDLHSKAVWAFLWELASADMLLGVIGGPPCRTVSRLRMRQPGPPPLRGRGMDDRWGLAGLAPSEQRKTDYDSMLMLKQVALWRRAEQVRTRMKPTMFLLESPEDPSSYMDSAEEENFPTFWIFPELEELMSEPGFVKVSFDQGVMGHVRRKPTTLLTNLEPMSQLNEMREAKKIKHPLPDTVEDTVKESGGWAKWAPGLVRAIIEAGRIHLANATTPAACRKLDVEGFKRHIQNNHMPYRRDCKQCLETMGQSEPHRRLHLDGAAYCLSLDLAGPFPLGKDEGFNKKSTAKYILVGTAAIPRLDREEAEGKQEHVGPEHPGEPLEEPPDLELPGELQEEPREEDQVPEEEAEALNQTWKEKAKELSTTVGLQQVTMVEVLDSRHTKDVVPGTGRIYAKMKAFGIPIHRIHTDRERCFITSGFRDFCLNRSLYQTMTSGDTPQENGRVESEINQVKRRMRLMLAESQLPRANWPNIARWVGEQRCRAQLQQLGVPTKPMISPGTKVMVKQKLWNKKAGALSNPYKRMTLLGPSPLMSSGWVVKDGHKVQHAKVVVIESPESEAARLELHEALPRRLHGKQAGDPDQPRLSPPKLSGQDPIEALPADEVQPDEVAEPAEPAEPVPDFVYSPESPLPDEDERPALHAMQAGGEPSGLKSATLECMVPGEYQQCSGCGLMQPNGHDQCGFCLAAVTCSSSSRSGLAAVTCSLSTRSGVAATSGSSSSSSGSATSSSSSASRSGLEDGPDKVGDWKTYGRPTMLMDQIREEHWRWKQQWNLELARAVVGAEAAALHGEHLEYLEDVLVDLEEELSNYDESFGSAKKLKAMRDAQEVESVHPVLQTYTVGLAEVRRNIEQWKPAIQKELESLFETTQALKRTTIEDLMEFPDWDQAEQAPAKIVSTVKAPDGRKKIRIVICGNLVQSAAEATPAQDLKTLSNPLYAGGLDGTALRAVARKAAAFQWSLGSTDIKTAFLLAPRKDQRLMVIRPPQLLIDCGLAGPRERWIVSKALYGLETSPRDWGQFRDEEVGKMSWKTGEMMYRFRQTTEPNIWRILASPLDSAGKTIDDQEETTGFMVTYVDDILVAAPREIAESALGKIRTTWECSPVEWTEEGSWMRFCGMEFQWHGQDLRVGQASYAKELISRHGRQQPRACPGPKVEAEVLETEIAPEDVKVAQQLVGEILWLTVRTRPDLAYVTSWMGRHVAKAPKLVKQVAMHALGYLQETADYALVYGPCEPSELLEVVAYSDASHAPQGGRGCQGILVQWGGATVQWEAKAQPFAALSSTEAELIGYVDALTMGESFGAIVNALESNRLALEGQYRLRGDNLSGLQLLSAPDGPWRTRHLRLRSFVLRERIANRDWVVEHIPGAELCVDLLTKPIVTSTSWLTFCRIVGLELCQDTAKVKRMTDCLTGMLALGRAVLSENVNTVARTACAVGISSLAACLQVDSLWKKRDHQNEVSKEDLKRARSAALAELTIGPTTAYPREEAPKGGSVERKGKTDENPKFCPGLVASRDHEPEVPRVQALRMSLPVGRSASAALYEAMEPPRPYNFFPLTNDEFLRPPASGKDKWERVNSRWIVKVHKEWRQRSFHPLHKRALVPGDQLEAVRFSVVFFRGEDGQWERLYYEDNWQNGPRDFVDRQWVGFTFFKMKEEYVAGPPATSASSSSATGGTMVQPLVNPGRICNPKGRARAAGPLVLRGSIARSFPGGVLPATGSINPRPQGGVPGVYQAEAGLRGPYGDREGNDHLQQLREDVESESKTSDPVTEMISERAEDPQNGVYEYMLGETADVAEQIWFRTHDRYPDRRDELVGLEHAPPANGQRVRLASLHALHGQSFVSGLDVEPPVEEDAFSDTFSTPGEAIQRLLEENQSVPHGRVGGDGDDLRGLPEPSGPLPREGRRVPAGHPEWRPPPNGGVAIEIRDDAPLTESDDDFELLEQ